MKPYSATPALRMTPLAERAVAKLDAWLREDKARQFSDTIDQLRASVDHLAACSQKECPGGGKEACKDGCCWEPCEECAYYRDGDVYQRPLADLLGEVEAREAALFEVA